MTTGNDAFVTGLRIATAAVSIMGGFALFLVGSLDGAAILHAYGAGLAGVGTVNAVLLLEDLARR